MVLGQELIVERMSGREIRVAFGAWSGRKWLDKIKQSVHESGPIVTIHTL